MAKKKAKKKTKATKRKKKPAAKKVVADVTDASAETVTSLPPNQDVSPTNDETPAESLESNINDGTKFYEGVLEPAKNNQLVEGGPGPDPSAA